MASSSEVALRAGHHQPWKASVVRMAAVRWLYHTPDRPRTRCNQKSGEHENQSRIVAEHPKSDLEWCQSDAREAERNSPVIDALPLAVVMPEEEMEIGLMRPMMVAGMM
jgi:hypothetical protein